MPAIGSLCSGNAHEPSQDFLRIALQTKALPIQSFFFSSLLSQLSDLHCGQKAPLPPDPLPLYLPQVFPPICLAHLVTLWHLFLTGPELTQKSANHAKKGQSPLNIRLLTNIKFLGLGDHNFTFS